MTEPDRPLRGRRIAVTRRRGQAETLVRRLAGLGATVVEIPAIEVAPPFDTGPLDEALSALGRYGWLVLTSANAVDAVKAGLDRLGIGGPPPDLKLASVGRVTTDSVQAAFPDGRVEVEPADDFRAEGLLRALADRGLVGSRLLLPVSDRARPELADGLRALGARVDEVVAYRTVVPADLDAQTGAALAGGLDLVLFASPSAVEGFSAAAGPRAQGLPAVAIGPTTAAAARAAGLDVRAVATPSTAEGLVAAALRILTGR